MNLYQASRCYFQKSQSALKRSLYLSAVLLFLAIVTLRPSTELEDAILILSIASCQLFQIWLKYRALYWFSKGDTPRRMDQLMNGLGLKPSEERCAAIEQEIGKCDAPIDPNYWVSRKPTGAERMVEMILESSFYTRSLAAQCRNLFLGIGGVGLGISIAVLIVGYRLRGHGSDFISHVVLTILVFFLTGDFWTLGFLYNDLAHAADDSHKQAVTLLKAGNISFPVALETAMDYNTSVVQAPPLLTSKHLRSKDATDEIFRRNYSKLMGLPLATV